MKGTELNPWAVETEAAVVDLAPEAVVVTDVLAERSGTAGHFGLAAADHSGTAGHLGLGAADHLGLEAAGRLETADHLGTAGVAVVNLDPKGYTVAVGIVALEHNLYQEALDTESRHLFLREVAEAVDELQGALGPALVLAKDAIPGLPVKTEIQAGYFAEPADLHPDFVALA